MTTFVFGKVARTQAMGMKRQATRLLEAFFHTNKAVGGAPQFSVTANRVIVQVLYYTQQAQPSHASVVALANALSRCWGRPVELRMIDVDLNCVDASILAKYLGLNSSQYSFVRLFRYLKSTLPLAISEGSVPENAMSASHITGVEVQVSGRLPSQRSGPRQTVKSQRIGSAATGAHGITRFRQQSKYNPYPLLLQDPPIRIGLSPLITVLTPMRHVVWYRGTYMRKLPDRLWREGAGPDPRDTISISCCDNVPSTHLLPKSTPYPEVLHHPVPSGLHHSIIP
ncbi:Ribosomal protein S3 (mitochondrion) [Pseudohyphozyma bogoriensis]|nr:Ribosomal protein S3 [Pseudohyphozyma bogoriensis]